MRHFFYVPIIIIVYFSMEYYDEIESCGMDYECGRCKRVAKNINHARSLGFLKKNLRSKNRRIRETIKDVSYLVPFEV